MTKKLYVTDLDGTILNSIAQVSDYTAKVFNNLIASGINITYSTARSFYTASPILKNINFNLPCITLNGAKVVRADTGEIIKRNLLDMEICNEILAIGKNMKLIPYIFGETYENAEKLLHIAPSNKAQQKFITERKNKGDKRLDSYKLPLMFISNLSYHYSESEIKALKEAIDVQFNHAVSIKIVKDIYCEGYCHLEISNKKANKGDMLAYISSELDIDLSNVTVFGDQSNDIDMFKIAGTRVAVANANPELKKYADIITDSNEHNGVAKYLLDLFGN